MSSSPSQNPRNPQPEVELAVEADGACQLVLIKREHRYVFRCAAGEEADLLHRLSEIADDPGHDLSWFDAAVLSHQIGRRLR